MEHKVSKLENALPMHKDNNGTKWDAFVQKTLARARCGKTDTNV